MLYSWLRRRKRNRSVEELILGHQPGTSDSAFNYDDEMPRWVNQPYKRYLIESAQEAAMQIISGRDDSLTKHSPQIIAKHHKFFDKLSEVKDIIVLGQSLSPVDWDYFEAVYRGIEDKNTVHWFFGCYGLRDLQSMEQLMGKLGLSRSMVSVFRTDTIRVTPHASCTSAPTKHVPKAKISQKFSDDRQWMVKYSGGTLKIVNCLLHTIDYETSTQDNINKVYFTPAGKHLFVINRGYESGVLLFRCEDEHWSFVDELKGILHQGIINRRLNQVVLNDQEITFVYNSRIRVYDLKGESLVKNQPARNAKMCTFDGIDVSNWFVQKCPCP